MGYGLQYLALPIYELYTDRSHSISDYHMLSLFSLLFLSRPSLRVGWLVGWLVGRGGFLSSYCMSPDLTICMYVCMYVCRLVCVSSYLLVPTLLARSLARYVCMCE